MAESKSSFIVQIKNFLSHKWFVVVFILIIFQNCSQNKHIQNNTKNIEKLNTEITNLKQYLEQIEKETTITMLELRIGFIDEVIQAKKIEELNKLEMKYKKSLERELLNKKQENENLREQLKKQENK